MSRLTSSQQGILARARDWERSALGRREAPGSAPSKLMIAGLVALGLTAVVCYVLAPDVKRYMKIRNM